MTDPERYYWHAAFAACPGGCGVDADALIDRESGAPVEWACGNCGLRRVDPSLPEDRPPVP